MARQRGCPRVRSSSPLLACLIDSIEHVVEDCSSARASAETAARRPDRRHWLRDRTGGLVTAAKMSGRYPRTRP